MRGGEARMSKSWAGTHVTLQRFMTRDLGLSGASLMAFAIIHGFAQASGSCTSPLSYFRWWSGCCKTTAIKAIDDLERDGLVRRSARRAPGGGRGRRYTLTDAALHPASRSDAGESSDHATVTLYGYMVSELGLRGTDLIVYALVAELCQLGGAAEVPLAHLASWVGGSVSTARRAVRRLEAGGLIETRTLTDDRGRSYNRYSLGPSALSLSEVVERGLAPTRAEGAEKDAQGAPEAPRKGFSDLRSHVPNTDFFKYGREAYEALLADGHTHEQIVAACDSKAARWRDEHPDREARYAPRCQRFLEELRVELSRPRPSRRARRAVAPAGTEDLLRVALARDELGPLGLGAQEVVDALMRAGDAGREEARRRADEWVGAHRAELEALAGVSPRV